jgi:hypothetical protein
MMSVMEVALEGSTTNRVHKELSSAYEDGDEGHAALGVVYVIKTSVGMHGEALQANRVSRLLMFALK